MVEENKDGETSSKRVLVVGASGYLGRHIVARLRQAGYPVRALLRDPARLEMELARDVEIRVGQVTRMETLEGLCDGISIVVSALGLRSLARKPTPWEVDFRGNLNVLTCAQRAGVERFVFVGVLHGADWRGEIPVLELREHFVDKLRRSGLAWTVLRPTGAFNDMQLLFEQARAGRAFLFGSGEAHINPIHASDVADAVENCLVDDGARNKDYAIGGPEVFTYNEIARMAFQELGREPRITHVAPWLLDGASLLSRPFNANAAGFLRFFRRVMTTDMIGTPLGQVHLRAFFAQLARQGR